jgi:hypothetical protein
MEPIGLEEDGHLLATIGEERLCQAGIGAI